MSEVIATQPGQTEEFNPLLKENVIERDYTSLNISVDQNEIIPEPTFEAPPMSSEEINSESGPQVEEERTFNKEYTELPNKEKREGAELMADAIIDGYASIIGYAGNLAVISESKLEQEIIEGTISAGTTLQVDENGTRIPVREYVKSYNEQAKEAFTVSQEFKETVKPPLTRVLQKRGAALTDEQFLAYHFGKDILEKGVTAFAIRSQNNQILNFLREESQANRVIQNTAPIPQNELQSEPVIVPVTNEETPSVATPKRNQQVAKNKIKPNIVTEEETFSTAPLPSATFSEEYVAPQGMPEFGNPDLLKHMEAASKIGTNKASKIKSNTPKK